ncbi:hypothetical protein [Brevundimonas sp.]|uniref:hypothetical protein n=1 Tax=Brevundimonas sp. TaxID=1871086 RepID=UPI001ACC14DB|nr:hypothetical protein [Brevundimonas sp.]MBN9465068.1 hypothetical protein [Brevundimonas sp.]
MIAALFSLALAQEVANSDVVQSLAEAEAAARISNLHMAGAPQVQPFATVSALGSWRDPNEVLSLFAYGSSASTTVVVRKTDLMTNTETVASSQRCRGLKEVVTSLEQINLPEIDVPLLGLHETGQIRPTVKDGISYSLWMPYPGPSDDLLAYGLNLRFTSGSSFERWYQRLTEAAASCWRPTPTR